MAEKNILIVDDISFIIDFEKEMLHSLGKDLSLKIKVDSAYTLEEALQKISQNNYDAVITDINLPDGSGITIAQKAKEKNIRVAAFTINPYKKEEHDPFFDAFLQKPIMSASYVKNIRHLLNL